MCLNKEGGKQEKKVEINIGSNEQGKKEIMKTEKAREM
jgi:hypothetical protein